MSSFIPIAQNSSFFSEKKIKKLNLNSHDIKCAPNPLIKNFFSNLGYKNASKDIVWEKPIVQKKNSSFYFVFLENMVYFKYSFQNSA